ncbi:precorrin-6A synthase (deacetylating) [Neogemmobacter tilapiae]|uniref:Precorrin-6A synthase [deacetylating] n=1 Tax=Neogemmobacter tilapiae TaxID=875041 RepID=A0A918TTR9_9RHOB|nr:precorrin-6A synthase (deacetylating) [Gemmobacter tilapiae]GHC62554.1 precorrin-6A synthase (deacetylating) [Gemmobacter tilapiae]
MQLFLIGIGSGNPDHLTLQAVKAINAVDLILIPRKGAGKEDLADLRRDILAAVLTNPATKLVEFDLPVRDEAVADYAERVNLWHDAIAGVWAENIGGAEKVALLVWGDPSLYDSTLRIAARLSPAPQITVIPGITSIQALTAGHAIPLNELAEPVTITTGRQLRDHGFPMGVKACVVMLDGECSFQTLPQEGLHIWWAGYAGMAQEIRLSGALAETGPKIIAARAQARAEHGWIMDIYLLRRRHDNI